MMIMFGEYQILILLRDKIIILTKPPLIVMSGVVRYHLIINGKTEEEKDECTTLSVDGINI
jgi:hypothetical protein